MLVAPALCTFQAFYIWPTVYGVRPRTASPSRPFAMAQPRFHSYQLLMSDLAGSEHAISEDTAASAQPKEGSPSPGSTRVVLQKHVILSGLISALILSRLALSEAPRLFTLHVACMAPMVPLGTTGLSSVRQRKQPPSKTLKDAAARKRRSEWLVIRHFVSSASALYIGAVGLMAIYQQKELLAKPHLATLHSWAGVATLLTWLATYLSAQPQVWRDQLRTRRFSLLTNKRWLWASKTHRDLGKAAFMFSLFATGTGLRGWNAVGPMTTNICCVGLCFLSSAIDDGRKGGFLKRSAAAMTKLKTRGAEANK